MLSNDIENSPSFKFSKALNRFIGKLIKSQEEECKGAKKGIKPEAFEFVRNEIRDRVKDAFRDNLKQRQRSEYVMQEGDEELLAASCVAYVMHHSERELQNLVEETHSTSIIEKIKKMLRCLLYTSPSPRDQRGSRMPSSA